MNFEAARIRFWVTLSLSLPASLLKLPNESGNGRRISPVGSCPAFCAGGPVGGPEISGEKLIKYQAIHLV